MNKLTAILAAEARAALELFQEAMQAYLGAPIALQLYLHNLPSHAAARTATSLAHAILPASQSSDWVFNQTSGVTLSSPESVTLTAFFPTAVDMEQADSQRSA